MNGVVLLTAMLRHRVDGMISTQLGKAASAARTGHNARLDSKRCDQPPSGTVFVPEFEHAVNLLRLVLHDLQQTALLTFSQSQLERTKRLLRLHEAEAARLRRELANRMPGLAPSASTTEPESRGAMAVHRLLNLLQDNHAEPLHLKKLAASLGMNASYLSDLFARKTGLRFQDYLNELRLARAKDLLVDPLKPIKEIARAVGYADPNSFRQAFKSKTGLAPAIWRTSI